MPGHPFTTTLVRRWTVGCLAVAACLATYGLLTGYTSLRWSSALADSLLSAVLFFTAAYLYWPVAESLKITQILVLMAVAIQGGWIGIDFVILWLGGLESRAQFLPTLPFRLLFGLLGWTILAQWYNGVRQTDEQAGGDLPEHIPPTDEPGGSLAPAVEWLERISVKDGTRIHLIPIGELWYLQAGGDYVTLTTSSGEYVKEQTLKYFETHLPPTSFVRIHRSCIVNVQQIVRVELFGKENYQVKLKCGVSLRASLAGYKLLKERLSL